MLQKFQYILSDYSSKVIDIDGDEFAECDYGLVVDNSNNTQEFNNKIDMLAQAALQNQALTFSTIMKLYGSSSIAEKQKFVEIDERKLQERQAQAQQQQIEMEQQKAQVELQAKQMEMQQKDILNQRDNETKILVAEINSQAESNRLALMNQDDGIEEPFTEKDKAELKEKVRQFDAKLKLDKERLSFDKEKAKVDAELKRKQISKSNITKK